MSPRAQLVSVNVLSLFTTQDVPCVSLPRSVAQWAETKCAPTGTVGRMDRGSIPGRPLDFVFGFQGRML